MAENQDRYSKVPAFLKSWKCWLVWKYGAEPNKKGKLPKWPIDLATGATVDRADAARYSFQQVCDAASKYDGIGFLSAGDIIGIDVDGCRHKESGELTPEVQDIIRELDSYTEVSPSGTGIRIWVRGEAPKVPTSDPPDPRNTLGQLKRMVKEDHIEIYPDAWNSNYLTVTGDHVEGTSLEVAEISAAQVTALYARAKKSDKNSVTTAALGKLPTFQAKSQVLDSRLKYLLLERGEYELAGYTDASSGDFALVNYLLKLYRGDKDKVKEHCLSNPSAREKWSSRRDGKTYIEYTIDKAPDIDAGVEFVPLQVTDINDFLEEKIEPREALLVSQVGSNPIITVASINQLFAWRGGGKSLLGFAFGNALARGANFLCWRANRACKVLYVEGEMPQELLHERAKLVIGKVPGPGWFKLVQLDKQPTNTIRSIATEAGRAAVEQLIEEFKPDVLFLDSISTLANISTNEEESWLEIVAWFWLLRSKYKLCVWFMQHAGKAGLQRGHSKSEDPLDISIKLVKPADYVITDGLRSKLEFDKTRGRSGEGFQELEVRLQDGKWKYEVVESETRQKVKELYKQDSEISGTKVGKLLDISSQLANRYLRELREEDDKKKQVTQKDIEFK